MSGNPPPLRTPVGPDAHRWRTFPGRKTVVAAARTVTSTVRVLETLPDLLRGDDRLTVVFAYDPTSAFGDGVLDLLHDAGCRVMPWSQLADIEPDLIVSASENIDVPAGDCPVLVLPHGVGFQKLVPDSRSARSRLSGMVPDALLEAGRAWLAVSHPEQEEQLAAAHPKTAGRTLLVGDPCFDQLLRGLPRRSEHRRALGVTGGRRLAVLSSTWGPTSLLGRDPDLVRGLLAALPYDEYRLAAITHPNVRSAHGDWETHRILAPAVDAGLLLMSPVHDWRPALTAADVVIGDHGSVTLYGAALGKPVLLAAFGSDAVPETAAAGLGRAAPRLDPHGDLYEQVEEAVRTHAPDRYADIARRAFADPGQAVARLRTAVYELLKLPEPRSAPPLTALPAPAASPAADVTSWRVVTSAATAAESGQWSVTVRRRPAAAVEDPTADEETAEGVYAHLASDVGAERDQRLAESASVLVNRAPARSAVAALRWIDETLAGFTGGFLALAALDGGGALAGLRDGRRVEATATGSDTDPGLCAAVIYTCLRAGIPLDGTVVTLRVGAVREEDVALRLRPIAQLP
ncbi:hypothetical protein AB0I22_15450 [Streptomyces sp. NPDC050610]|uniref:hypothetical protein n=1 Tax=Streptomyces sp. NPDC050610 TaxID=3157097 RepID=UPI0034441E0D